MAEKTHVRLAARAAAELFSPARYKWWWIDGGQNTHAHGRPRARAGAIPLLVELLRSASEASVQAAASALSNIAANCEETQVGGFSLV